MQFMEACIVPANVVSSEETLKIILYPIMHKHDNYEHAIARLFSKIAKTVKPETQSIRQRWQQLILKCYGKQL